MDESPSLVKNASDPAQVKEAGERERSARERNLDDLLWVLSDRRGRRFLWNLMAKCGLYERSHVAGLEDATAFNEGQRHIGLHLLKDISTADENMLFEMMKESKNGR